MKKRKTQIEFKPGQRVSHPFSGKATVVRTEGNQTICIFDDYPNTESRPFTDMLKLLDSD